MGKRKLVSSSDSVSSVDVSGSGCSSAMEAILAGARSVSDSSGGPVGDLSEGFAEGAVEDADGGCVLSADVPVAGVAEGVQVEGIPEGVPVMGVVEDTDEVTCSDEDASLDEDEVTCSGKDVSLAEDASLDVCDALPTDAPVLADAGKDAPTDVRRCSVSSLIAERRGERSRREGGVVLSGARRVISSRKSGSGLQGARGVIRDRLSGASRSGGVCTTKVIG